jgi:hypothetical protein
MKVQLGALIQLSPISVQWRLMLPETPREDSDGRDKYAVEDDESVHGTDVITISTVDYIHDERSREQKIEAHTPKKDNTAAHIANNYGDPPVVAICAACAIL